MHRIGFEGIELSEAERSKRLYMPKKRFKVKYEDYSRNKSHLNKYKLSFKTVNPSTDRFENEHSYAPKITP